MARRKTLVVITGCSGRLGQLLVRRLHRLPGMTIVGIDRRQFDRKPSDVEHLRIDIRRKACEDLFRTRNVDIVYHLGLMHDPRKGSGEHHTWNLIGTQRIVEYAHRYRVPKVVILSSGDVYGPMHDNPAFLTEDAPLLGAEHFPGIRDLITVDMFAQSAFWKYPEIEMVVLRPAHILGRVRNAMSNYMRMSVHPVLFGYDPMIQVLHEEDAVSAIVAAARPGVRGVFNVVGPTALPLRRLLAETRGRTIELPHFLLPSAANNLYGLHLSDMPSAETDYLKYAVTLDGTRGRELLRFDPRFGVREAVRAAEGMSICDGGVPRIGTPASSSSCASLSGVWPPICTITPTGSSRSQTASTSSSVSGSKYSRSEVS